jgi:hypothetical protein
MRVVRAIVGTVLVLVALPLFVAGGGLALISAHRGPGGAFGASIQEVSSDGYALIAPDVDRLLRRDAPFARGGQTRLRLTVRGTAFVGLAPSDAVDRYLGGVPVRRLDRVRLARGPLPVDSRTIDGRARVSGPPADQPFWLATSRSSAGGTQTLDWSPSTLRGRSIALVVMNADASAGVHVGIRASLVPLWLGPAAAGLLILGAVLLLLALTAFAWPAVMYVLESSASPAQPSTPLPNLPPVALNLTWPPRAETRPTAPVAEVV